MIYYVDDSAACRCMFECIMSDHFEVKTVEFATDLLGELPNMNKTDLVVLDYILQDQTQLNARKSIQAFCEMKGIPICFLTGSSERVVNRKIRLFRKSNTVWNDLIDWLSKTVGVESRELATV